MTRSAEVAAPKVPSHVAVIMDGNGRWAKQRGLPRIAGHRKGQERVRELAESAGAAGVKYLTLFAFSSENWRRPKDEVRGLLDLFLAALNREIKQLHENQVRFRVIGDRSEFGEQIVTAIDRAESLTRANTALTLTIAANYGGRWDIAQACRSIAREVRAGSIDPAQIGPELIEAYLATRDLPAPDLFIRTGGEQRISNFLLWQLAYTELYFTPMWWPDFDRDQFAAALAAYADRERRFGQTGDQVNVAGNA